MPLTKFINCKILRDHKFINEDLWVRNGKIVDPEKLFFDEQINADVVIDCKGNIIAPGFIELQINGGFGYDFSYSENTEEAINTVAKLLLEHGVTSFCPTLVTSPKEIYHRVLPKIKKRPGGQNGATVLGAHVEGPFINVDKKGAHPPKCIIEFSQGADSLIETYGCLDNIKIVTLAPELNKADEVIKTLKEKNIVVSLGHSNGDIEDGEEAVKNGATLITHLFNAMPSFHHRDPGLVGLLASSKIPKEVTVYFGIISDGIHTHPSALRIAYKTHPKGLCLVTDAISAIGLEEGEHNIGQFKIEIRDEKAFVAGTNTLCGSIACMIKCVQIFKKSTGCSKEYALEAASLHPAEVLGIQNVKGTLSYNSDADFIILTENLDLISTWIAGECVFTSE